MGGYGICKSMARNLPSEEEQRKLREAVRRQLQDGVSIADLARKSGVAYTTIRNFVMVGSRLLKPNFFALQHTVCPPKLTDLEL